MLAILKWTHIFGNYVLWMMMVYLTDVWELEFVHAATIMSIWLGLVKVLPLAFLHLADAFFGNFWILFIGALSNTVGFVLLWLSTPPVLANSTGNCAAYKPECIGGQQKQLFYAGLALTAIGNAAQTASYTLFLDEQGGDDAEGGCNCEPCYCQCCGFKCRNSLIGLVALLTVSFVKSWAVLFGIGAIIGVISLLVFLIKISHYNRVSPQGSALTTVFRVLFAASSKLFHSQPQNVNELYENNNLNALLPHTQDLRFLDKAAIVLPNPPLQQQERQRWKLCRVTEVEETKTYIRAIPIWMAFILCGIVSSLGPTYFLEQTNRMNPKVGKTKIPVVLFLWLYAQFRNIFTVLFGGIFTATSIFIISSTRHLARVGFAIAMVFAILSCIAAAKVETRRLRVVTMNRFWVLPQFALLGGLDGIYLLACSNFALDQAAFSMMKYFPFSASAFSGIGFIGSALCAYIVGSVSEKASGINWFQSTINTSRLDNYYWFLASLISVNLVVYIVLIIFYRFKESRIDALQWQVNLTLDDSIF
ncbi:protein NRT1/ PTR FAMILY 5.5-like [Beta vulgaris subsp. vulgaris]|uniref:protein NRT1/ PTR FAMILY 5.5-like n=1 Tax=Beta vulgaris subsp. vulgaris TaxID=3555 RepID=UPI0020368A64|nr:protein NRT1/ PTR FAMILY 5.5-like [Beta vulgaris subsp. vulgaris]